MNTKILYVQKTTLFLISIIMLSFYANERFVGLQLMDKFKHFCFIFFTHHMSSSLKLLDVL